MELEELELVTVVDFELVVLEELVDVLLLVLVLVVTEVDEEDDEDDRDDDDEEVEEVVDELEMDVLVVFTKSAIPWMASQMTAQLYTGVPNEHEEDERGADVTSDSEAMIGDVPPFPTKSLVAG